MNEVPEPRTWPTCPCICNRPGATGKVHALDPDWPLTVPREHPAHRYVMESPLNGFYVEWIREGWNWPPSRVLRTPLVRGLSPMKQADLPDKRPDQEAGLDEVGSKKSPIHAAVAKPTSSSRGPMGASPQSFPASWPKPIGRRLRLRIRQIFAHPDGPAAVAEAMDRMPEPFTLADVMKAFHRAAYKLGIPRPEFGTRPKQSRNQEPTASGEGQSG